MKKVLVSILMISTFFNLIPAADQIVVEEIKPDNKLLVTYDKLRQRLLRMPQLLKMFEQLHSPEIRGEYEKYLDHRYEFDVTLNKYELAADLKSALKRFNDSMAPQKKIAWWKRKSVMIPLALAMAATGLFAGVGLKKYNEKRDMELVEKYKGIYKDQADLPYEKLLELARDEQKRVQKLLVPMKKLVPMRF